jgi:hypothetical protein
MINPPAIQGPARAGVQKAAVSRPAPGARFAPLNKVTAKTTVNPVNMMPKAPVDMSAMKGPTMNLGKSVPISPKVASATTKLAPVASKSLGLATKALGPVGTAAALVTPDQGTKTEPGNPVFRKTDAGKTSVAGYRSSTTPRATDSNTQKGMVGSMARRGGLAPSVKNQELPKQIAPVQTKEPGTLSAPTSTSTSAKTSAASSFKQAFAQARKEAGSGQGQFTYKDKQYQTNLNPAKGAEKYIAPSAQKVTSVSKTSSASTTAAEKPSTPGSTSVSSQPAPSTASTAGMSSAAEKSGISQTPTTSGTEFGAGKNVSSTPMPTTPAPKPEPATASPAAAATNASAATSTPAAPAPKAPEPEAKGAVTTAPEKKQRESGTSLQNVAESVQVGNYKYRIV